MSRCLRMPVATLLHPVFYSRDKIDGVTEARLMLEPRS
jgi:hypothetical protein